MVKVHSYLNGKGRRKRTSLSETFFPHHSIALLHFQQKSLLLVDWELMTARSSMVGGGKPIGGVDGPWGEEATRRCHRGKWWDKLLPVGGSSRVWTQPTRCFFYSESLGSDESWATVIFFWRKLSFFIINKYMLMFVIQNIFGDLFFFHMLNRTIFELRVGQKKIQVRLNCVVLTGIVDM